MAKKSVETITGFPDDSKLTVQKSTPLMALWRSELTLAEFKILDGYLARIDSHKPERRRVLFEKGQLEKMLGVKKINHPELEERLRHLMGSVVKIPDSDMKRGFRLCTLFEEAEAEQDDSGLWQISLECTQKAMKYFFGIENLGYLRYKLRCITPLQSRYSYILFCYLEQNRFRRSWSIGVDDLKTILRCDEDPTYSEFKYFNKQILKRCSTELNKKTECQFKYETIKRGRAVVAVQFTVFPLRPSIEESNGQQDVPERGHQQDDLSFYNEALDGSMTPEQMTVIMSLVREIDIPDGDDIDRARYRYLMRKWAVVKMQDSVKPIRSKYLYLKKMLEGELG